MFYHVQYVSVIKFNFFFFVKCTVFIFFFGWRNILNACDGIYDLKLIVVVLNVSCERSDHFLQIPVPLWNISLWEKNFLSTSTSA